ncbi:aromatic ring-hydroxylating dioxygenase subunit alpha [Actinomadura sp. KC06]|uniref:aromatic ring-hydroxylating oxygenase subunit alpha n=1 Tax=Actinomadura sp. KC06 TaxID=2530369 RepID=UPI001053CD26|nr:aromatic ring-hydroxylating dioxygenase subunit alpha [Actinomadura sp. KC06]TDD37274.1 aromatic ring-hydroxylating dioxygenase subunit alpha [Actinomadura sp. KC06]
MSEVSGPRPGENLYGDEAADAPGTDAVGVGRSVVTAESDPSEMSEFAILPKDAYTSEEYLGVENRRLFSVSWMFAAFVRDVAEPGDVVPAMVQGVPIFVVRDEDGSLKAFHNVCSHRGSQLVCEPQKGQKTIVCPYHAWTYKLGGELAWTKHFAGVNATELPDRQQNKLGLKQIAVTEWLDFVFVNFSAMPEPFENSIAELRARWADYDLSVMRHGASLTYDFKANWKLIVENFLESYHVPFIHKTLNTYSPFSQRYQVKLSDRLMGIGTGLYEPDSINGLSLPKWPLKGGADTVRAEYFSVYPTFLIGVMPDHLFAWILEPISAGRTIEHLNFYFVGEEGAYAEEYAPHRRQTLDNWKQVNDEDWEIIQRMHAGMQSPAFPHPLLSREMERNINAFQTLIRTHVGLPGEAKTTLVS